MQELLPMQWDADESKASKGRCRTLSGRALHWLKILYWSGLEGAVCASGENK